jgi:hypothetical protein
MLSATLVAIVAMTAAAASTAHAQPSEPAENWPAFTDAFDDKNLPPVPPPQAWTPSVLSSSSVVTAPLPQAVVTGLFMLGGNWVVARMWKKRKI